MFFRMSLRSSSSLRVRYGETDQMGVAYHANYLAWCEVGRTELIRDLGMSYADIERQGYYLAVAEASIRYKSPARYDDVLRVETWVESVKSRVLTFAYSIHKGDPATLVIATARTTLVSIDADGAPRRLPDAILDLFRGAA
jgi:acyl-CoA thioester hydrolase